MNKVSFPDNPESTNLVEWYLLYFWIVLTIKFKMTGQNGSQKHEKLKKVVCFEQDGSNREIKC